MAPPKSLELDAFDIAILNAVQRCYTTPLRVIGEQVNLSTAAVQRRIKRMEEAGVIVGNVAVVDPERVGKPITGIVEVHAERTNTAAVAALKKALSGPEVQQCYYVTGEADFVLILNVATMTEYEALARRLFDDNDNIKWYHTAVVLNRVKVGLEVPLD
ncbi:MULTISPECIES: Lrp/AsnC family transcriptional regulator [Ralstonia]|uniref:DNA-binding transcriptional activator DecR n=1 Tax=Ralstonia pickettii TaxID=329 RepID=A0ABN9HXG6_RALPI|nr:MULTISPECIES: Lrp/AsnC family transcriptional regulator [Ralstonia]MBE3032811.1 Lrp/AsnC family transcriptional regulator [Actinomycetota bacterium]RYO80034.1 hypothetical protein DL763_009056 [Monosporascus cannonballus]MBA4201408.1 AsnC family transcriptional regulator [Ralstonia sp.]MBA4231526.1 AsnC family transcriptional regulator [Ralstonia sp.]MBA4236158.1 AsnC family transcriptional regulator [Ralstonia sp.]